MTPVVLLHGFMETAGGHFGNQIAQWRDEHRVLAPDLPGHGRCPVDARAPYGALLASYVGALLEKTGPAHVVAASYLGGPVAVRLAAARPDLVASLTLTGLVPDVPEDVFTGWLGSFTALADQRADVAAAYERVHGPRWRQTFDAFIEEARDRYAEGVQVTTPMLRGITVPVLVANGSVKSAERAAAERAAEWGGAVRGVVIDGGGHIPGQDRPAEFAAAVTGFWREVRGGARAAG